MLRSVMTRIRSRLSRFRNEDEGSVVAEVVILFPLLFGATIAIFVFFDAFRNQSINLKANYTIADALSRESDYITNDYMRTAWRLHRFLTNSRSLTELRISVIRYNGNNNTHRVVWSRVRGGTGNFNNKPISRLGLTADDVPAMPHGEILIVVQTSVDYEPDYSIGLGAFTFENTTFTRPRWNPEMICYSPDGTEARRVCPIGS